MATNFPASLDSLTNPTSSDSLNSPSHSAQHANVNDAVEALQAKVGADSSAVTTSLDYKVAQLEAISHGKILQIVSTFSNTGFTTSSTSFVDVTDATLSITPTSVTSKVFIMFSGVQSQSTTNNANHFNLVRDSTAIAQTSGASPENTTMVFEAQANVITHFGFHYLDSPATTSATTYKLQMKVTGTSVGAVGRRATYAPEQGITTITAFEVSA